MSLLSSINVEATTTLKNTKPNRTGQKLTKKSNQKKKNLYKNPIKKRKLTKKEEKELVNALTNVKEIIKIATFNSEDATEMYKKANKILEKTMKKIEMRRKKEELMKQKQQKEEKERRIREEQKKIEDDRKRKEELAKIEEAKNIQKMEEEKLKKSLMKNKSKGKKNKKRMAKFRILSFFILLIISMSLTYFLMPNIAPVAIIIYGITTLLMLYFSSFVILDILKKEYLYAAIQFLLLLATLLGYNFLAEKYNLKFKNIPHFL
jgi:cation transport ATPase